MYNEQTFVVKNQTFSDTAVKELADTKARLLVYKYYHIEKKMQKLPDYQRLLACYSQMSDYDKIRVDNAAADLFAMYMQDPEDFMPYEALKRRYRKIWLFFFGLFMVLASCLGWGAYTLDALFMGFAFNPSNQDFIFAWVVMPGIPAICWGLAKLVMIHISSDALNIAKAREILSKHEM